MGEGQWRIDAAALESLNQLDEAVENAVNADNQDQLSQALNGLHDRVRAVGTEVPDDELVDSDLILPNTDATVAEVRAMLAESKADEGLIPEA